MGFTYGFMIGKTKEAAIESDYIYTDHLSAVEDAEAARYYGDKTPDNIYTLKLYYDPNTLEEDE